MRITIVAGARPNFMKLTPINRAIEVAQSQGKTISYRLIYTGKKGDTSIDASLFSDLQIKEPNIYLGVESNDSIELAAHIMLAFRDEMKEHPAHVVIVVDDLTPTMSCAIVAKKMGAKVAHVVAGTRSFDMTMPKEVNRMITDGLSDYLFTAGVNANRTLTQSGTETESVFYVGNILIDNIRFSRNRSIEPIWFNSLGVHKGQYLLLTLNRRSLLNDPITLRLLLEKLIEKANGTPIIAPVHNYVRDAIVKCGLPHDAIQFFPPQRYLTFAFLMNNAKGVVTDSGNIAEETTFLGVPCITINDYAEHPETWRQGTNELVGESTEKLETAMTKLMKNDWKKGILPERWDGRTAERIIQILLEN